MEIAELIRDLKKSNLWAECPSCDNEFKIKDAVLFDGNSKIFPAQALKIQQEWLGELKERQEELKKAKNLATKRTVITTTSVNIGKSLEKIFPTLKDFKLELPDCRFLGDPIDIITFNGLSLNKINSINFIEVKSGKKPLEGNQKLVKDAIEDKKVSYKVFK